VPRPPHAEPLPLEDPRRLILDPLADDHLAANVGDVEHAADGVAGGRVRRFLVPLPHPPHAVQRGNLRRAEEVELDEALDVDRHDVHFFWEKKVHAARLPWNSYGFRRPVHGIKNGIRAF